MVGRESLHPLIPEGDYCYSHTGKIRITNRAFDRDGNLTTVGYFFTPDTKVCPFWKFVGGGAFCAYTGKTGEYDDFDNMIWDQIKECGVNTGENLFEDEEERVNDPSWVSANTRAKRYPDFIQSLINILLYTPNNELVYDGITYTLDQHIINNLRGADHS